MSNSSAASSSAIVSGFLTLRVLALGFLAELAFAFGACSDTAETLSSLELSTEASLDCDRVDLRGSRVDMEASDLLVRDKNGERK